MNMRTRLGRDYKLGVRLVSVSLIGLIFGLTMVIGTLWLSWALEGAAAAINDTGSLRMQSVRIGLALSQPDMNPEQLSKRAQEIEQTFSGLKQGDPQRPLRLPGNQSVQDQFRQIEEVWDFRMAPILAQAALAHDSGDVAARYLSELTSFVSATNRLVMEIEAVNARDTSILRASQLGLIALMLASCVALIYLLYGWVIRPVQALRIGIEQMSQRNFDARVPVEGHDEFGELASGFNSMAAQLKTLYSDLEGRVNEKTRQLALQNKELSTMYEFSAYLSQPGELVTRCEGFLAKLIEHFGASGGTVRILDPRQGNLHMTVHQGLSKEFVSDEQCLHAGDCLCGDAAQKGVMQLHDFRQMPAQIVYRCEQEGFNSIAIAQIMLGKQHLGSYTLHFRIPREFSSEDRRLFEAVGQHLGVAIENHRLLSRTRQLAVAEERNILAQGLHDSIAQGLNFLKLQIQMLEDSIRRDAKAEVGEVIRLLSMGVRESYDDVRELLTDFRVKLGEGDLNDALHAAAKRFTRQTGIQVDVDIDDRGAPLSSEQQLQVLFIAQEAISNIRKHAHAKRVSLRLINAQDFDMCVSDDGAGFDPAILSELAEQHIGLNIMKERATQLAASLEISSRPGQGTQIRLHLDAKKRVTA